MTRRKRITIFIGLPGLLFALAISGWVVLRIGERLAGEIIKDLVATESNDYYRLSFESLTLDPVEKSISIQQLALYPDSTKNFSDLGLTNLYQVDLEGLSIRLASIMSLYFNKELIVNSVRIIDPGINLIRQPNTNPQSFGFQAGNLYKAISDYLKVLKIDNFRIEDANFQHFPSKFRLENIDFFVRNLLMDSTNRSDRIFYSETIELEINNQVFYMPDSVHQITFDRFILSTRDSVLQFENLKVQRSDRYVAIDGGSDLNLYDIRIPLLSLRGVDYNAAYRENRLHINELQIADPDVYVEDRTHTFRERNDDGSGDNSLLRLFFNIFAELKVGKLSLLNATLDLTTDLEQRYQSISTARTDLAFYNILLDTTNYRFDRRHTYFDHIDLIVRDYTFVLPDSLHTVHFDMLNLNSRDSSLQFENFDISNSGTTGAERHPVNLRVPKFRLIGVDFQEAIVQNQLFIDHVIADKPFLRIDGRRSTSGRNTKVTPGQFYEWARPLFEVIDIQQISLSSAAMLLEGIEVEDISLEARDFRLDNKRRSWKGLLGDGMITIKGIELQHQEMNVTGESMTYDHKEGNALLNSWTLSGENDQDTLDFRFDKMWVTGVEPDSIAAGSMRSFDSMLIFQPRMKWIYGSGREQIKRKPLIGTGQFVRIEDGEIQVVQRGVMKISADTLDGTVVIGENTIVHELTGKGVHVGLDSMQHDLMVGSVEFSDSTSNLMLSSIHLGPRGVPSSSSLGIRIPEFFVYGLDQQRLIKSWDLDADSIRIPLSDIYVEILEDFKQQSSVNWRTYVSKIILGPSTVHLTHPGTQWLKEGLTADLSFVLHDFRYPENALINDSSFLHARGLSMAIDDLVTTTTKGDSLSIDQITISTDENVITLDSIYVRRQDGSLLASVPGLVVSGTDRSALSNQMVRVDSIWIDRPGIFVQWGQTGPVDRIELNSSIDVNFIEARGMLLTLQDSLMNQPVVVQNGGIKIEKLSLPERFQINEFPDYLGSVHFTGEEFEWEFPEEYTLHIGEYAMHYPKQEIVLQDIALKSAHGPLEYNRQIDFQKDWFDLEADEIMVSNLDTDRLISTGQWRARKIAMRGLQALIYRDKSVPFPEDQVRYLPQKALKDLNLPIDLDSITIKGSIEHQLKPANYHKAGVITFDGINATLLDVTNIDTLIEGPMLFKSTGKLMHTGSFSISVAFDMNDPLDRFSFTGTIRDLPLDSLNRMLEPVAGVKLEAGYGKNIWFDFDANDNLARGTMKFRYNDLKVLILDPETHEDHGLGPGLKTFFANTFVVKKRNPGFIIFPRDGRIFMERDKSRAIFDYWGKALLSGAVSSVGINKSEKAEKEYLKAHGQED